MTNPDFYLASTEGFRLDVPRHGFAIRRLRGDDRDDYLLARVEPPLIGQPFGLGDRNIDQVILATRHAGASLFPIQDWPVHVYVVRSLVSLEGRDVLHDGDMEMIAWAEL